MEDHEIFENVTILSLEQATVLPYLTYRLALDGANIIRMEHPVYGDPNRRVGENKLDEDRMYTYYLAINSNKKAITLDLGTPEGQEIFKKLLTELFGLQRAQIPLFWPFASARTVFAREIYSHNPLFLR